MDINYVSGFFDADGSITLAKINRSKFRAVKIDFTNTKKSILIEIQDYLTKLGIRTTLCRKPPKKHNHSESFVLAATYDSAYELCKMLDSHHPIKRYRIKVVLKYYKMVTLRNGHYTERQEQRKLAFERLFFSAPYQE